MKIPCFRTLTEENRVDPRMLGTMLAGSCIRIALALACIRSLPNALHRRRLEFKAEKWLVVRIVDSVSWHMPLLSKASCCAGIPVKGGAVGCASNRNPLRLCNKK